MTEIPTKVTTPVGICSYPALFAPKAQSNKAGAKAKYSLTIVFTPEQQKTPEYEALKQAALEAGRKKFGADFEAKVLKGSYKWAIRKDGEEKGYGKGTTFINLRSDGKPGVVSRFAGPDGKPQVITAEMQVPGNPNEVYPGCLVRASVSAYGYDTDGNRGVSFGLNNVQKMGEGARIDGRKAATEEFEADLTQPVADLGDVTAESLL